MSKCYILLIKVTLFLIVSAGTVAAQTTATLLPDERISAVCKRLTVEEKIDLLCAKAPEVKHVGFPAYDWWSECLHGVARAGKATVFPKPIAMGSMWDTTLVHRIATAVSDEARAKYHKAVREKGYSDRYEGLTFFSPTLNIARDPRWGRTSECFSEDPVLTGAVGIAFIQGLQGDDPQRLKLVATAKHFVANNEENRRHDGSAEVDELSLREYYFPAFRASVEKAHVASFMGAYNALNGVPCCANPFLLTDILRKEWGFDGAVISDGSAVAKISTHHHFTETYEAGAAAALKAGCDMSLRDEYRDGLRKALSEGLIAQEDIDAAVTRVLTLRFRLGMFDPPAQSPYSNLSDTVVECVPHQLLALEAAQKSVILLKNTGVLPLNLKKIRKLALIGDAATKTYYGDYSGKPDNNLNLADALRQTLGNKTELLYVSDVIHYETIPSACLLRPETDAYEGLQGFTGEYFSNPTLSGVPALKRHDATLDLKQGDYASARWTSTFIPPTTGEYSLKFEAGRGRVQLFLDDKLLLNGKEPVKVQLQADGKYKLRIECTDIDKTAQYRLSWLPPAQATALTPETAAKQADAVVIFIRDDNSSEGRDRKTLALNPTQEKLIERLAELNPNTVLVLGCAAPLLLNNVAERVNALLNVWIAGQGEAQAIANILTGKVNPSGKTPVTFYKDETQLPPLNDYNVKNGRSYQYFNGEALFPFGFGMSYTRFRYSRPTVKQTGDTVTLSVKVSNTGAYDGEEVVQCYVASEAWRADGLKQKLVAFKRIALKKGKSGVVEFSINNSELQRWNTASHRWELLPGEYEFSLVPHSASKNTVIIAIIK
jgi:beta-glucosidase